MRANRADSRVWRDYGPGRSRRASGRDTLGGSLRSYRGVGCRIGGLSWRHDGRTRTGEPCTSRRTLASRKSRSAGRGAHGGHLGERLLTRRRRRRRGCGGRGRGRRLIWGGRESHEGTYRLSADQTDRDRRPACPNVVGSGVAFTLRSWLLSGALLGPGRKPDRVFSPGTSLDA